MPFVPGGASGKEPACQRRDIGDEGSIPGSERSPGGGHGTHSSLLAWRIPWTEEPGGLQSIERQGVTHDRNDFAQHSRNLPQKLCGWRQGFYILFPPYFSESDFLQLDLL